jgi:hypothetical protein
MQAWQRMYTLGNSKLQAMRSLFEKIKNICDEWSGKLQELISIPGVVIGSFGIIVSLLVLFFSLLVRCERSDGLRKEFQLFYQNVLFLVIYTLCDIFVIVSFLLSLLFVVIGVLQASLTLICSMDLSVCHNIRNVLAPGQQLVLIKMLS